MQWETVCEWADKEPTRLRLYMLTQGLGALLAVGAVRPSFAVVSTARLNYCWKHILRWRSDTNADVVHRVPCADQTRARASAIVARLVVLSGRPVAELTADDLLTYRLEWLRSNRQTVGLVHVWLCLADLGTVEGSLHQSLRPGQKSVAEFVDGYDIECRAVRDLFVDYLTQRSIDVDYSTLRAVVNDLIFLYWKEIEEISPGITTIDLPTEVATEWKRRIRTRTDSDGNEVPRRGMAGTLMAVRGFYADLIQLAHEEPARWAPWACKPPITDREVKAYRKWRLSLQSDMHERTRHRAVKVTELASAAERAWSEHRKIFAAAQPCATGDRVVVDGKEYVRTDRASHDLAHPKIRRIGTDGEPVGDALDLVFAEEDAFWGFAIIEVLRQTGIRIEELLELTQLDLHEYDHRDPEIGKVILLHVNPSKQDKERMVVVAPELAAVFAAIVTRIRTAIGSQSNSLPFVVAYDYAECVIGRAHV